MLMSLPSPGVADPRPAPDIDAHLSSDAGAFFGNLSLRWGIRMNTQEPVAAYRRTGGDRLQDWDEQTPSQPDIRRCSD